MVIGLPFDAFNHQRNISTRFWDSSLKVSRVVFGETFGKKQPVCKQT